MKTKYEVQRKKVFWNYDEVAHIWAQQKLSEGRTAGGRMYFNRASIFSYGSHFEIARFVKSDVVLFTTRDYSPTTSTQKQAVRRALRSGIMIYDVPSFDDHNENAKYFREGILERVAVLKKGRANFEERLAALEFFKQRALGFLETFGKQATVASRRALRKALTHVYFTPADLAVMKERDLKHEESMKRQLAALVERRRAQRLADDLAHMDDLHLEALEENAYQFWKDEIHALNRTAWLNGLDADRYSDLYDMPPMLRVNGEEIETSHGARVPITAARELWALIFARKPVHGFKIGHYTVSGLANGLLTIGCHDIPVREVARMAVTLGLETQAVAI